MSDDKNLICPKCGYAVPEIDCEKTTYCKNCDTEWKYDENQNLIEVEDDDDLYFDR